MGEERRTEVVSVRLTEDEAAALRSRADGLPLSDLLRTLCLNVPGPAEVVRLSVNLPADDGATLKGLATARQCSTTEVIRRAIGLLAYVEGEAAAGRRLAVLNERGKVVREVVLL